MDEEPVGVEKETVEGSQPGWRGHGGVPAWIGGDLGWP